MGFSSFDARRGGPLTPDGETGIARGRYARLEYERRWLLRALPSRGEVPRPWARITDHYLDGTRFRVREYARNEDDVVWKLTQKYPQAAGTFDRAVITNSYLTQAEYVAFCRLPGRPLAKQRWVLDADGGRYGVDVFRGGLDGLVLAEREYASYGELRASPPPPFDATEVTHLPEFTGGALAGRAFADLRDLIESILPP